MLFRFLSRVLYWICFTSPLTEIAPPLVIVGYLAIVIGLPLMGVGVIAPQPWMLSALLAWIVLYLLVKIPEWQHEPWTPVWFRAWARGPRDPVSPSAARP